MMVGLMDAWTVEMMVELMAVMRALSMVGMMVALMAVAKDLMGLRWVDRMVDMMVALMADAKAAQKAALLVQIKALGLDLMMAEKRAEPKDLTAEPSDA